MENAWSSPQSPNSFESFFQGTSLVSINPVRRKIDRVSIGRKAQNMLFFPLMDKSTVSDSEALFPSVVRYLDESAVHEEMLLCEALETATTGRDKFEVLQGYLSRQEISIKNIVFALLMEGNWKGCLKVMRDENPEILIIRCVILRDIGGAEPSLYIISWFPCSLGYFSIRSPLFWRAERRGTG